MSYKNKILSLKNKNEELKNIIRKNEKIIEDLENKVLKNNNSFDYDSILDMYKKWLKDSHDVYIVDFKKNNVVNKWIRNNSFAQSSGLIDLSQKYEFKLFNRQLELIDELGSGEEDVEDEICQWLSNVQNLKLMYYIFDNHYKYIKL